LGNQLHGFAKHAEALGYRVEQLVGHLHAVVAAASDVRPAAVQALNPPAKFAVLVRPSA